MAKFAFIYFMKHLPDQIHETVPLHVKYWHDVNPPEYQGGPFADRSGGLIIFNAGDIDSAMEIINKDPFILNDLLDKSWVKEWLS